MVCLSLDLLVSSLEENEIYDHLPSTQQLILEVLAARRRLGENLWTFGTKQAQALAALSAAGLVRVWSGTIEKTCRASLTDVGLSMMLDDDYIPPILRKEV